MSEYYKYGTPSEEWKNLQAEVPDPAVLLSMDPLDAQVKVNQDREAVAAKALEADPSVSSVQQEEVSIPVRDGTKIPGRVYRPGDCAADEHLPTFVFYHGGGFLFGSLDTYSYICKRVVASLRMVLIHVCYRHTPTYQAPTQVNDAWDGFEWAAANAEKYGGDPQKLIVGGISAGANLTGSVIVQEIRNTASPNRKIIGQMLGIPLLVNPEDWIEHMKTKPCSYAQNEHAPLLNVALIRHFNKLMNVPNPKDDVQFPGYAPDSDLAKMPKTVFLVAGMDPLRDEGIEFDNRLKAAGVETKMHIYPGLPHGFSRFTELPSTKEFFKDMVQGLAWFST